MLSAVPAVFEFRRDSQAARYVDLAIAAGPRLMAGIKRAADQRA